MATAREIYASSVRGLAQSEKLRLATMILEDLTQTSARDLDYSDSWSDEDVRDVTAFALRHAAREYQE